MIKRKPIRLRRSSSGDPNVSYLQDSVQIALDQIQQDIYQRLDVEFSASLSASIVGVAPVGAIIAWHKNLFSTTPTIPEGWAECNGQVIADIDSPMNGQQIPNLNGLGKFLRGGSASGVDQAQDFLQHTHTGASHSHSVNSHTHDLSDHTHNVTAHQHSLDAHTHTVSHSHGLGSHTHTMAHYHNIDHGHTLTNGSHAHWLNDSVMVNDSGEVAVLKASPPVGTTNYTGLPLLPMSVADASGVNSGGSSAANTGAASGNTDSANPTSSGPTPNTTSTNAQVTQGPSTNTSGSASPGTSSSGTGATGATGGTETRPVNMSVVWIMRFK